MVRWSYIRRYPGLFVACAVVVGASSPSFAADSTDPNPRVGQTEENELRPYRGTLGEAVVAMEGGHYDVACPAIRKIFLQERVAETLFRMAQCYDRWGKIATAHAAYGDYLTMLETFGDHERLDEKNREEYAVSRHDALEKRVPWITLYLPMHAPTNTTVTRRMADGGKPVRVELEKSIPIDPGEHVIQTLVPTGRPVLQTLVVREGERKSWTLKVDVEPNGSPSIAKPLEQVAPHLPDMDPPMSRRRIAVYGLGIGGATALAVGLTTGIVAFAQDKTIDRNCIMEGLERKCNEQGKEANDLAKIMMPIGSIALPLGFVAIGTAVALHLTEPPRPKMTQTGLQIGVGVFPGRAKMEVRVQW